MWFAGPLKWHCVDFWLHVPASATLNCMELRPHDVQVLLKPWSLHVPTGSPHLHAEGKTEVSWVATHFYKSHLRKDPRRHFDTFSKSRTIR